ncbi:hypothetical protein BGW38_010242 [Lunasporangiospora selenospora]|uniref:Uncharacterized protein n=1 Tax=Lunasporangiospora selenospora TaxID=979761 RepID=A0A9P6G4E7_9FUNG|nr:hypothetical protein BGW38_010242 [Lunasporangiospora selenospora]
MDPTTARSLPPLDDIVMEMPQDRAMQQPRQPPDTGDDSDNQSSNDGIEWESSAYISSNDASEDEQDDGYRSSDGDEPDTQQLLSAADYSRVDGLGMGMRVGETGTGTTIGFGYDPDNNDPDEDYDALPLGKLHASRFRQSEVTNGRARKSKRRVNDARRTIVQPVLGLGAIRTEQEQVIAKKQFKTKMLWNAFFVFAW